MRNHLRFSSKCGIPCTGDSQDSISFVNTSELGLGMDPGSKRPWHVSWCSIVCDSEEEAGHSEQADRLLSLSF